MKTWRQRNGIGSSQTELAAALIIVIPLFVSLTFVAIEAAEFYMIKNALNLCAVTAARRLAVSYGQDPNTTMAHPETVFSTVTYSNIVNSATQFSVVGGWTAASSTSAPMVTVQVTFQPNVNGAAPFPNPDPLHLGQNLSISSTATCLLE